MPDDDAPAFDRLDEEAYQRALAILLDVGTSIARELKQADPAVSVAARAAAFDRVALAIRRTIILSQHVAASAVAAAAAAAERVRRRKHLLRTVEEKIDQLAPPEQVPELRRELLERLDQPETDDDLTHLPPHKVLAMICADLGLQEYANTPTLRRTPDDIALLCAQAAAAAGSGLPQWAAAAFSPPPRLAEN